MLAVSTPPPHCKILPRFLTLTMLGMALLYGEDNDSSTESLKIESQTDLNSAQYNIAPGSTNSEEDKKRKVIGIGESITLTANGKPLGDLAELSWQITSGKDAVNDPGELKGQKITLEAKKSLTQKISVAVTYTTSEGRSPAEPFQMEVLVPTSMDVEHLDGGTITDNHDCKEINDNGSGIAPSAQLKVTLQPLSVNFRNILIVERDSGSIPEGCSLDPGHQQNGTDELTEINEQNAFVDNISGAVEYQDLVENGGQHQLPQSWEWISTWHIHNCEETGCPGNELPQKEEPGELPAPSGPHSTKGDTHNLGESRTKFEFGYKQNAQGENSVYAVISKFGYSVSRTQGETQNNYQ